MVCLVFPGGASHVFLNKSHQSPFWFCHIVSVRPNYLKWLWIINNIHRVYYLVLGKRCTFTKCWGFYNQYMAPARLSCPCQSPPFMRHCCSFPMLLSFPSVCSLQVLLTLSGPCTGICGKVGRPPPFWEA